MTDPVHIRVPAQVEPYVDALGEEDALRFLMEFGGSEVYISARPRKDSPVVKLVGMDKAKALHREAYRLQSRVPLASKWIAQVLYHEKCLPKAKIARMLRTTDVTVRRYVGSEPDRRQTSFDF